jgi:hypothetical protein
MVLENPAAAPPCVHDLFSLTNLPHPTALVAIHLAKEYFYALADALQEEYEAIVNTGFVLQLDSPNVPMMRNRQLWMVESTRLAT